MAFEAYDDYEQSELVRQWLRQNGVSIIVGIVLGLLLIFGWQQWRHHQAGSRSAAATQYQALQQALAAGQDSRAETLTDGLLKDHPGSAYAVFASSERARRELGAGHADKALAALGWAESHADAGPLKSLTTLRMARVQLAAGKAADTLATLKSIPATDYRGLVEELRGDALVKLGRADEARQAYQAALSALDEAAPQRPTVQVKLDNLAVAGKQGA
jgi:predicted negative regulator of RcsB-dependent stress response